MTYFLLIAYLKITCFYYFLQIYDVIKNNCDDIFFINCIFENDMFLLFLLIRNYYDDMFFY